MTCDIKFLTPSAVKLLSGYRIFSKAETGIKTIISKPKMCIRSQCHDETSYSILENET